MSKYRVVAYRKEVCKSEDRTLPKVNEVNPHEAADTYVRVYRGSCPIPIEDGVSDHLIGAFGHQARLKLKADSGAKSATIDVNVK